MTTPPHATPHGALRPGPFRLLAGVVLVLLTAALPLQAQSLFDEGRTLEFRADQPWTRLALQGPQDIDGVSPLRIPGALEGEFWLSGWGPGVERQLGRVRVRLDEGGPSIASYGARSFSERALYSVLYPGIVQYSSQQKGKGLLLGLGATAGLTATIWAQTELWNEEEDVDSADRALASAVDEEARRDAERLRQDQREERDFAIDRRNIMMAATGAVWGLGLLDAFVFSPDFHVARADENAITLEMRRKTRFDAVARSLVFPGLGQEYNGEGRKAVWVTLGAVAGSAWLIHRQLEFAEAVMEYDQANNRFNNAITVDERNQFGLRRQQLYARVEDRERDRNLAIGILGGYWALAALETAISFGDEWGGRQIREVGAVGVSINPARGEVAAQWGF